MEQQMVTTDGPCFQNLPIEMQQHIFSFCGTKTRREITLVCKDWAKKLEYFHEDFRVYLNHCYLREDLEPVSLLMKSTRRWHSLCLGDDITSESKEVQTRFFSQFGREVQDLDISSADWEFLGNPDFLLYFPQLKKLTLKDRSSWWNSKSFPETLEHVHVVNWYNLDLKAIEFLRGIKNLKLLTSNKWFRGEFSGVFTLDENLKVFLQSMTPLDYVFKSNKNFLNASIVTFDDVLEIKVQGPPLHLFAFNKFPNLRSIYITCFGGRLDGLCLNIHQSVLCAGVSELKISDDQQQCIECFKSIIDSFPNVKKIVLNSYCLTNQHVQYIFSKLPNLIHLETNSIDFNPENIFHDEPEYSIENLKQLESLILPNFNVSNVLLHWPPMPHLKKVQFGALYDFRGLNNFTEKTPNLESFEIGYGSHLLSDTAIEIIAKNWPNLRTLRIRKRLPCDLSIFKRYCQNLRTLELRWFDNITSFFDAIPTLMEIKRLGYKIKHRHLKERDGWD